jgi:hypothetical protein
MQLSLYTMHARLRGALDISAPIVHVKCFKHGCGVSAWGVALVRLCAPPSFLDLPRGMPAGSGYGHLVWGSSCFDWTSTSAHPQQRVFCTLAAPINLYGDETTVGVRSLAQRIARLSHFTCRILLFVFRSRTRWPVPWLLIAAQPRHVSLRYTLLVGLQ